MRYLQRRLLRRSDRKERADQHVQAVRLQLERRPERDRKLQPHDWRMSQMYLQHRRTTVRSMFTRYAMHSVI